jgi:hypothetical protein
MQLSTPDRTSLEDQMNRLLNTGWKILRIGGWVPLLVFTIHLFLSGVVHVYDMWPPFDIPMHFAGGLAIALFVSRCFQTLPREDVRIRKSRVVLLELVLIGSLTATAAVCWEFMEFTGDRLFGSNVQLGLANTMQDMAMGILGAMVVMLVRSRQLHVGSNELREITADWVRGMAR